ncbi:MAG: hypothetical protein HYV95_16065 [Opitutae bacterium]|nr:hypothetical protein [Opitutae bacterium]
MNMLSISELALVTGGEIPPAPTGEGWWDAIVAGLNAQDAAARWAEWYATYGQNQQ